MIVPSLHFLLFAAVCSAVFNLSADARWHSAVLLVVNIAFLSSFAGTLLAFLPFLAFIVFGFIAQRVTPPGANRSLFPFFLLAIVGVFVWLKRYYFIPQAAFLPFPYVIVGLSYVFFRVLHLLIENHQGAIQEPIRLASYLNYTMNFTSLVSGPIQQFRDYDAMQRQPLPMTAAVAGCAIERIILGYFKVAVVSTLLLLQQHAAIDWLASGGALSDRVCAAVLIAGLYLVYLYFNFSGYMDVVIGTARFFRLELPENFDRPFSSENFIVFWSRWHITLSNWLKTYIYNPVMLAAVSRIGAPRLIPYFSITALFITFFLIGLWHGQTTEFLFYGFLLGGGVATNRLYQMFMQKRLGRKTYLKLSLHPLYRAGSRGLTIGYFAVSLLWFWSNWAQIGGFFQILGIGGLALAWVSIVAGTTLVLQMIDAAGALLGGLSWNRTAVIRSRYLRTAWSTLLSVMTLASVTLLDVPADIVYKTF